MLVVGGACGVRHGCVVSHNDGFPQTFKRDEIECSQSCHRGDARSKWFRGNRSTASRWSLLARIASGADRFGPGKQIRLVKFLSITTLDSKVGDDQRDAVRGIEAWRLGQVGALGTPRRCRSRIGRPIAALTAWIAQIIQGRFTTEW